jgi:alpha-glucuronidase
MLRFLGILFIFSFQCLKAEDGYELWLRYASFENKAYLQQIKSHLNQIILEGQSPTTQIIRKEIQRAWKGMLGTEVAWAQNLNQNGAVLIGTSQYSKLINALQLPTQSLGNEGFMIKTLSIQQKKCIVITANTDVAVLYGVFHFLRLIQTQQDISKLSITESPKLKLRILNHWDNLNRTVERGYAGFSLWDWQRLPDYLDSRYTDYARANASIGINGTVLTNVNANALILTEEFLPKVAALANVFRPYGIKVYLTARFSAPMEIGGLKTADPLDSQVQNWWKEKVKEIYQYIPDFGGFLVKANSEGQPGPQNYGRNHADGANMLADALAPFNGIVMWRAFVYDNQVKEDRHKQAYNEFVPLDGKFKANVLVQVKNGAIDFQPREPFHPLFGAMPKTPLMMEFQITQEYLGFATHLVFLPILFKECLESDTYAKGKSSTIAKVIAGSLNQHTLSGMAGVANIGNDRNWCGHPFGQANWYGLGRLAWNPEISAENIGEEWIRMTFSNEKNVITAIQQILLNSHETTVNYMTPLGLHHIMGWSHHFGPAPWIKNKPRADWTSVYYHQADSLGIGFNRTSTGSNALSQYAPEVRTEWENLKTCPEKYLLWFHHLPWTYQTKSGKSLWEAIVNQYYNGVESVRQMQKTWQNLQEKIDEERFEQVKSLLKVQEKEAVWWRNACVLYFQTHSKMPIPANFEKPDKTLEYYQKLEFHYVPGN